MNLKGLHFFFLLLLLPVFSLTAQTFDGEWSCDYATIDDRPNGTSYNTIDVGVIKENTFVALVSRSGVNYLVGYADADSVNGRLGVYGYGGELAGYHQQWVSGFEADSVYLAVSLAAAPDSLIYVANNEPGRSILVFKLTADSVVSTDYRIETGADSLWAIAVDAAGHVFVTSIKDASTPSQVIVYPSIAEAESDWSSPFSSTPLTTITVPDPGELRGITVNDEGTMLFVSNYDAKKVYAYVGDATTGYTLNTNFNLEFSDPKVATDTSTLDPGPWGLKYLNTKNILFMAADVSYMLGVGYEYAKMFLINPNSGEFLDTIDVAEWNYAQTGSYQNRPGGTLGNVSGYASTYNVDVDENYNVYSQSYYGWTVEKWSYSGSLPVIDLTGVEKTNNIIPAKFNLAQNYPNPFNPSTTIEFSLNNESEVSLKIYSVNGELVAELLNSRTLSSGNYKVKFDASKLASGTYIYTLKNGNQQISKKMILLK